MYSCEKLARGIGNRFGGYEESKSVHAFNMPVKINTDERSYFGNASVYSVNIEKDEHRAKGSIYRSKK